MSTVNQPPIKGRRIARTLAAFVISPLIPGLLFALPDLFRGDPMARWYLEFAAGVGYPVILVLGVPSYFLLKHWKASSLGLYVIAGAIWGAGAYVAAFLPGLVSRDAAVSSALNSTSIYLVLSVICGVFAAIAFWFIARPDSH
jgi:hypothetical protein